ncbi:type III-A CRISPR-associated RAMP protein Csm3 [Aeribacillus sp. FSL K6-1121]|jgi:CRISPR-associated protein Csm3|uniref:type III-A CRISPR-associated RAMP protein Csm3 n=1 Tax=Aeribacillus TaxID=1055323 RepID=UPI001022B1A8|nr:type III-A CRISPR-associated RAMP protein Csm3 [Aeribacillus pallidus]RZI50705.1 type III-A CRISPR-associated RAMP protein Csm3 [Aeribacillus pallidus]
MKLNKFIQVQAIMKCETGLRIGGSNESIEIGGVDNPIIRDPISGLPYVPGSSLKGKMRSLLESIYGRFETKEGKRVERRNGQPCGCAARFCTVCKVFGPHKNPSHHLGPSRLIVRDAHLTKEWEEKLSQLQLEKGLNLADYKWENTIDRIKMSATPRGLERVPAGTEFAVEFVLKVYDGDNEQEMIEFFTHGLKLLEHDYLGGSGSRGYGKVSFNFIKKIQKDAKKLKELELV